MPVASSLSCSDLEGHVEPLLFFTQLIHSSDDLLLLNLLRFALHAHIFPQSLQENQQEASLQAWVIHTLQQQSSSLKLFSILL